MTNTFWTKNWLVISAFLISIPAQTVAHEWMAPRSAATVQNPLKFDNVSVTEGKALFIANCAACHGKNGAGLKPENSGLNKTTPNLPERLANHSEGDFFWKIENGRGEMPSFKDSLTDAEIWHIVNFIKSKSKTPGN